MPANRVIHGMQHLIAKILWPARFNPRAIAAGATWSVSSYPEFTLFLQSFPKQKTPGRETLGLHNALFSNTLSIARHLLGNRAIVRIPFMEQPADTIGEPFDQFVA